jgi:hypothetical protein
LLSLFAEAWSSLFAEGKSDSVEEEEEEEEVREDVFLIMGLCFTTSGFSGMRL